MIGQMENSEDQNEARKADRTNLNADGKNESRPGKLKES
jgi:hypothetical protein